VAARAEGTEEDDIRRELLAGAAALAEARRVLRPGAS
jgi:hypothetical protein